MEDIEDLEDIKLFVDEFYEKIREDELLGPVFSLRIMDGDWKGHQSRMYDFWNTVLFHQRVYKGNPFSKHAYLPVEKIHFDTWVALFKETIDANFQGEKAEETKNRVEKMAAMFQSKIQYLKDNPGMMNLI